MTGKFTSRISVEKQLRRATMDGKERAQRRASLRLTTGIVKQEVLRRVPVSSEVARQFIALSRDIVTQPFRRPAPRVPGKTYSDYAE